MCPSKYTEKAQELLPLEETTDIPVYMKGTLYDYYILKARHEGLLTCIANFNVR